MKEIKTYIIEKLKINKDSKSSIQSQIEDAISNYLLNELNYKDFSFEFLNYPTKKELNMIINYHTTIKDEMEFRKKYFYDIKDIIENDFKLKIDSAWSDLGGGGEYPQKIFIAIKY